MIFTEYDWYFAVGEHPKKAPYGYIEKPNSDVNPHSTFQTNIVFGTHWPHEERFATLDEAKTAFIAYVVAQKMLKK